MWILAFNLCISCYEQFHFPVVRDTKENQEEKLAA